MRSRQFSFVFSLLVLFSAVGCSSTHSSMNLQRSGLRGISDLSVTVLLDRAEVTELAGMKEQLEVLLDIVEQFANDGKLSALTQDEVLALLLAQIPSEYAIHTQWLHTAITAALATTDTTLPIGENSQRRLLAFVYGSRTALRAYTVTDRQGE